MKLNDATRGLLYEGKLYDAYNYLGCHYDAENSTVSFAVLAPNAESVAVVGDFNNWDNNASVMKNDGGIWHFFAENVYEHQAYKYAITTKDKKVVYKSDPYAFHSETRGNTASKITDMSKVVVNDELYLKKAKPVYNKPVNIYEAHIGSWRKYQDGSNFDYRKFADEMAEYLQKMHYTHIELMGIAEYPFDGSWGYQVTGYYSPTSRYGEAKDFAYLVEKMHSIGVGVILDWVPGHFPKDENGLMFFDGAPLYEPIDTLMQEHKEWGTMCFNYSNGAVKSFLISNALFWMDKYHIDGLRVDAVASMLYLDYGRKQWKPNCFGGKENLDAIEFFKQLNTAVCAKFPNALMIAEESTAFPLVTKPVSVGGLGFNFKWNMGWMNDTLRYLGTDPLFRGGVHNNMTFSLTYAFSENFILPISHDEVVYGKGSLLNKSKVEYDHKFANFRVYLMYMYSHPGKKLMFMGGEFSQFDEWNYQKELDWGVLEYPLHKMSQNFTRDLNEFYLKNSPLYELEEDWMGFEWLVVDDYMQNVFVYERRDLKGQKVLVVLNFSPVAYSGYQIGVEAGCYTESLTTDINGYTRGGRKHIAEKSAFKDKEYSLTLDLPPYAGMFLKYQKPKKK